MNKIILTVLTSLSLLVFFPSAHALALSEIKLNSSLNQELDAIIEIRAATPQELDSLNIYVSRLTDDDSVGLYNWPNIKVELVRVEKGKSFLKLTSKETVREPVLNFLLELNWATGRIIREYSLLINPQF